MHSKLGASSAYRWMNCSGSVNLIIPGISKDSEYAALGTEAHRIAAMILETNVYPEIIDTDMKYAVNTYVDYIHSLGGKLYIEQQLQLTDQMWGTCDAIIEKDTHLDVVDYKHGAGIVVDVEDNPQLLYYALCASMFFPKAETFTLTIVQPRAYHEDGPIRSWDVTRQHLERFSHDLMIAAVRTEDPKAPLVTGDHCRFCAALAYCPKVHEEAQALAVQEFSPVALSGTALAKALDMAQKLEPWIKALEKHAMDAALRGIHIPGYALVDKRYSRVWNDFTEEELVKRFGDEAYEPKSLKSPAKLEKLGAIDGLWHKDNTGGKRLKKEKTDNENNDSEFQSKLP